MGAVNGNQSRTSGEDLPGTRTVVTDHTGRSMAPGASCSLVTGVDAKCVESQLELGRDLGRWTPLNNCQSFVGDVVDSSRTSQPDHSKVPLIWTGGPP